MTVELITGYAGTPHIGSADIGAFQAGIVGPGDYALATGNQLKATMSNANTIAVQSGDAVLNGRHVHLTGTTTATVQSGTQGQKRNDLAVLRYTKNTTTGVETCSIVVLKGTPPPAPRRIQPTPPAVSSTASPPTTCPSTASHWTASPSAPSSRSSTC